MVKLTKAIIKKYGISKKAWAIARGQKKTYSKKSKSKVKRFYTMAKKRTYKKGKAKSKGLFGFSMGKVVQVLAGAAIAAVYEVFVSPMIPIAQNIKNWIELALGLFLAASPKMPMVVRAGGAALATINAYSIIMPYISGVGNGDANNAWG